MLERYKTVYRGKEGEIIEKKSRFIATVRLVETEEEALAFIEEMKKKYWNATHNCFAYVIGERRECVRCSDDGEPSGTAGKPMLDVLLGEELYNTAVVVTRYFGGTLLGTGGLVRAYSKAVQEGLAQSDLISLHCPLMEETHHMINIDTIQKMKDGVILVNTSRGGLIKTDDLIQGIRENKFFAVGLDVYEEENGSVYEDMSETILEHSTVARLLSFPNVMVTSHQAFFTEEALAAISEVTLDNAMSYLKGTPNGNEL